MLSDPSPLGQTVSAAVHVHMLGTMIVADNINAQPLAGWQAGLLPTGLL